MDLTPIIGQSITEVHVQVVRPFTFIEIYYNYETLGILSRNPKRAHLRGSEQFKKTSLVRSALLGSPVTEAP
jgi:hypothetical protein